MASRIFAVLAAVFLVAAVAIFALTPLGLTLGQALLQLDRTALDWTRANIAPWVWNNLALPLLLRPLWLVPACLGLVCAGVAGSFNFRTSTTRQRRS